MHTQVDPRLDGVRQEMADMLDAMNRSVDSESDGLTVKMHRALLVTWLVALLGLVGTAAFAIYIVQEEVVKLCRNSAATFSTWRRSVATSRFHTRTAPTRLER